MRHALLVLLLVTAVPVTASAAPPLPIDPSAPGRCASDAGCPATYAQLYPYLERFCAGTLTAEDIDQIGTLARDGALDKTAVEALFNAYGAMYGYAFKQLKHLNTFFYDARATAWLPPSCPAAIRSRSKAKDMPFALTKQRDELKRLYDRYFPPRP